MKLMQGDCLDRMKEIPDGSVDSIVTDPPYGLGFMGKKWDVGVPAVTIFEEALRVLKPGGHLLAFGGSRTYHRLAVAVEDAGFEIRDQIMWVYGSGFPKSQNVSKAIDKAAGAEREKIPKGNPVKRIIPGADQDKTGSWIKDNGRTYQPGVEVSTTEAAKQWDGWGTALKPAHEPIVMARKPFKDTVANNVTEHGTGAINVDGCRVGTSKRAPAILRKDNEGGSSYQMPSQNRDMSGFNTGIGRWPANLIHDGSDEVLDGFPKDGRSTKPSASGKSTKNSGCSLTGMGGVENNPSYGDKGSAARFFYTAKASKKDRGEGNNHPTVKPSRLMQYLCRMVTPPGGVILDPFMGSGSTGKAARAEGFDFIGIELDPDYYAIAQKRIQEAQ